MLEGVTTDNASAVVATARALSRADVSASWVATAEARSQRLPLALPDSHQAAELKSTTRRARRMCLYVMSHQLLHWCSRCACM